MALKMISPWIDYNTIRALPYMGPDGPVVLYHFIED